MFSRTSWTKIFETHFEKTKVVSNSKSLVVKYLPDKTFDCFSAIANITF